MFSEEEEVRKDLIRFYDDISFYNHVGDYEIKKGKNINVIVSKENSVKLKELHSFFPKGIYGRAKDYKSTDEVVKTVKKEFENLLFSFVNLNLNSDEDIKKFCNKYGLPYTSMPLTGIEEVEDQKNEVRHNMSIPNQYMKTDYIDDCRKTISETPFLLRDTHISVLSLDDLSDMPYGWYSRENRSFKEENLQKSKTEGGMLSANRDIIRLDLFKRCVRSMRALLLIRHCLSVIDGDKEKNKKKYDIPSLYVTALYAVTYLVLYYNLGVSYLLIGDRLEINKLFQDMYSTFGKIFVGKIKLKKGYKKIYRRVVGSLKNQHNRYMASLVLSRRVYKAFLKDLKDECVEYNVTEEIKIKLKSYFKMMIDIVSKNGKKDSVGFIVDFIIDDLDRLEMKENELDAVNTIMERISLLALSDKCDKIVRMLSKEFLYDVFASFFNYQISKCRHSLIFDDGRIVRIWKVNNLMEALFIDLERFIDHPELYRKCKNPKCNNLFMSTRQDKWYCCDECRARHFEQHSSKKQIQGYGRIPIPESKKYCFIRFKEKYKPKM